MKIDEQKMDKTLRIQTVGREDSMEDNYHHPYEPTPYAVLSRLAKSGYVERKNCVVDYGCGKGRVDFYLSAELGCRTVGVEFDEAMCVAAEQNLVSFAGRVRPEFLHKSAENYKPEKADRFYFFNPFSVEILQSVLGKIKESYYENPREILLFFYYPDDAYVAYLITREELFFVDEIDCQDLFPGNNSRERILIFEM